LSAADTKYKELQHAVFELEQLIDGLPIQRKGVAESEEGCKRLEMARDNSRERVKRHELAEQAFKQASEHLRAAEKSWEDYQQAQVKLQQSEELATHAEAAKDIANREKQRLDEELEGTTQKSLVIRKSQELHREGQVEIDDIRQLLD